MVGGGGETTLSFSSFPRIVSRAHLGVDKMSKMPTNDDSLKACRASNLFRETLRARGHLFSQTFCRRIVPC